MAGDYGFEFEVSELLAAALQLRYGRQIKPDKSWRNEAEMLLDMLRVPGLTLVPKTELRQKP